MPAHFNWQTEEEIDWKDEQESVGVTAVPSAQHRWFRPLMITGLLFTLAGLVLVWQINRRAKAVTDAVKDDVIASYELLATAADKKDLALFHSLHLTDGRNLGWGRSLDTLMTAEDGLLNGRRPGLTLLTAGPQVADVVLAPDVQSAELVTAHSYAFYREAGVTETITLNQVYNYELQEDGRWLLAAPAADFWGEWQTYESQRLHLSYPTRDEAVSLQIAETLSKSLDQLCRWSAGMPTLPACPDNLQFQVRWRQEIGSLAAFDRSLSERMLGTTLGNPIIFMPSPTLVGTPAGEADEQVLIDLYVQKTMAAMIGKLQDSEEYDWYRFSGFNVASLNWLLVEKGIMAWPPPAVPSSDPGPPPIPWPKQAVALTCLDETGQNTALVRLEPGNEKWSTEFAGSGLVNVQMWPGGYLLGEYLTGAESSWAIIEPDGAQFPVPPTEEPVERMWGNGRYLIAPVSPPEQYTPSSHFYVLEWEQCLQGACQWHHLPGYPIWSPDESQFLLQSWKDDVLFNQILYGESLDGPFEFAATGDSPVWLDEGTFSYRKEVSLDGFGSILVAAPIGGEPETLLTPDYLKAIIPPQTENTAYWFYLVDVVPDSFLIYVNQYQTYSTSSEPPPSRNYLLVLDRSSGEITVVAEGEYLSGRFGGDGRYLITTQIGTGSIWSLNRYDIARKQTETLFQYDVAAASPLSLYPAWGTTLDWSEDGQWLLVFRDRFLVLLAPGYNYKQVIVPDTPGCFGAAWIKS